jgi:hypothetical protein
MFKERVIDIPSDRSIAGYTTTYNCFSKNYPFQECVESLLGFCDEVVVVDAGSTDGTIEEMSRLARIESRIKFYVEPVDFSHPRWAIHMDGYLKAKARSRCTATFCWQTDTDEIVPSEDYQMVRALPDALREFMTERPVIYLPMVEFWGSFARIRADFFSWKPRFSVNHPDIVHGIPVQYQRRDDHGFEYPQPFDSDSCNYIWKDTQESVRMLIPMKTDELNPESAGYEASFNQALKALPCVLHVSWFDLKRKIEHYREFWPRFHASMYNLADPDTPERNVMFDKRWSEVTDSDIALKAAELSKIGPRTFHTKLNPEKVGKTIPYNRPIPASLQRWATKDESLIGS